MFHVQPHRHAGKFDDGVFHDVAGTRELVSPSGLKWAAKDTLAMQLNRVEAGAIFDPQPAIPSRATHGCFSLRTTRSGWRARLSLSSPWILVSIGT
jgi:hypothetical protein